MSCGQVCSRRLWLKSAHFPSIGKELLVHSWYSTKVLNSKRLTRFKLFCRQIWKWLTLTCCRKKLHEYGDLCQHLLFVFISYHLSVLFLNFLLSRRKCQTQINITRGVFNERKNQQPTLKTIPSRFFKKKKKAINTHLKKQTAWS